MATSKLSYSQRRGKEYRKTVHGVWQAYRGQSCSYHEGYAPSGAMAGAVSVRRRARDVFRGGCGVPETRPRRAAEDR